ncbi:hypothetical protein ACHOLT_08890 [Desulfitobacterium sp. Sab5]|uniref:hypothetical protein n=1 Tax=Desulfitobacterium nosdiversum TaxID=3375356 RepID=UPI003CF7D8DB
MAKYHYQFKPLLLPGVLFLIGYPAFTALLILIFKISLLERNILIGLYLVCSLGILALWIYGRSKHLEIEESSLLFCSLSGEQKIGSEEIRRIAVYTSPKGKEIVQIKTYSNNDFYISDVYFPFPELMGDLEQFVRSHSIRSNIA